MDGAQRQRQAALQAFLQRSGQRLARHGGEFRGLGADQPVEKAGLETQDGAIAELHAARTGERAHEGGRAVAERTGIKLYARRPSQRLRWREGSRASCPPSSANRVDRLTAASMRRRVA